MAQLRHLPAPRRIAVVLLVLLTVTAVHGAASVAVPAVAVAAGPASIGATLLHQTVSPGGRNCVDDADHRQQQSMSARPGPAGDDHGTPTGTVTTPTWSASPSATGRAARSSAAGPLLRRGTLPCSSRAPPDRLAAQLTTAAAHLPIPD
ncbi:hypothetical protein O7543_10465 [Solwaraspora sp. WMMA2080]|uniref:hypothetical protein n=1 Tax=unclassified Solwaraspora TaxID=2627926 RepID=UPI00248C46A9|nr:MULTISPECIES: hypothetical protein [unclassified Solwaraspora]WBB98634.1 hypothetical protein O7553_06900 [Solwaraspora sp. WMMA2059]WBC22814.1 hypothetical protein O7543_10465 [Solwaraspora sp. WMMA2080]